LERAQLFIGAAELLGGMLDSAARVDGELRGGLIEVPRRQIEAAGEAGVLSLRSAVGRLHGPEQLLLQPVTGVLIDALIGLAQRLQSGADVSDRLSQLVEDLLAGIGAAVAHGSEFCQR